jgi:Protein of unknown function (DUF4199)
METKQRNIGLVYGLIAGACLVGFTAVMYAGGVNRYLSGTARLGYAIPIGLAAAAALVQRKANGGQLEFQAALKTSFAVQVLALASQTLFVWLLVNWLDVHFGQNLARETAVRTEIYMKEHGMPADDLKELMTRERTNDQFGFGGMLLGLAFSCIVQFIIALLIAAVVKKKKEE